MKGPGTTNDPGNYGTRCVSSSTNMPPARMENRARVRDDCGNFWNFGGGGKGGNFNDLWHYNISTNQWTWVSGDNIPNQVAVYGTKGISAPGNKPEAKSGGVAWIDNKGYIWIFGGYSGSGTYNDLFRYVPDTVCLSLSAAVTTSSNTTICIGQSATLIASGGTSYSWSPGGQSASGIVVNPTMSTTYTVIGGGSCGSGTSSVTVVVNPNPVANSTGNTTITQGQSATLTASGGGTYSWSNGSSDSSVIVAPLGTTLYCVTVTDSNNCSDVSCVTVIIEYIDCSNAGELYLPNAFSPNGDGENDFLQVYYGNKKCIKNFKFVIYNRWGETVFESTNPREEWDGYYKGKIAGTAVFVYRLEATLVNGEKITKKGNISLVR